MRRAPPPGMVRESPTASESTSRVVRRPPALGGLLDLPGDRGGRLVDDLDHRALASRLRRPRPGEPTAKEQSANPFSELQELCTAAGPPFMERV